MSAMVSCREVVIFLRSSPTRCVSQMKAGMRPSAITASRQSRMIIATTVASTSVTFETVDVAVDVTTLWTPPMSLAILDWTSPVRVRVKKARESRCRWR